ncbi:GGDEF domain-containing protein [Salinifilum ghardaiensis]
MNTRILALTTAAATATAAITTAGWIGASRRLRTCARCLREALRDPVTGLLTRHGWEQVARDELPQATAVAVVDLDGFKQINDRYGHAAGDRVLLVVAQRLVAGLGTTAVVGRLGGDELGIVTRGHCGARLNGLIVAATRPIPLKAIGTLPISASLGVAHLSRFSPPPSLPEALAAADAAMYEAKERGATWRLHEPSPPRTRTPAHLPQPTTARGSASGHQ